jgi:hypothetical protein
MANAKRNRLLKGVSGKFAGAVYRQYYGATIMANMPSSRREIPAGQQKQMDRFFDAARWAKAMMAIPGMKALYTKGITPKKNAAFRVAHTDFLNPPKIHYIRARGYTGAVGNLVSVKATDDFLVRAVKVTIYSADGKILESGDAENLRLKPFMWRYRATVPNPQVAGSMIKAVASDTPGNKCESFLNFD